MTLGAGALVMIGGTVGVAAFLTLAGLSKSEGLNDPKTVGAALVCAVTLIRVYWRFCGDVDCPGPMSNRNMLEKSPRPFRCTAAPFTP